MITMAKTDKGGKPHWRATGVGPFGDISVERRTRVEARAAWLAESSRQREKQLIADEDNNHEPF